MSPDLLAMADIREAIGDPMGKLMLSEVVELVRHAVKERDDFRGWLVGILTAPPDTTADEMREMANDAVILVHPWKRSDHETH